MRIFSHTCSNTEIVCALGFGDCLVGVDDDSDYPPEVVQKLPKAGRDLDLQVDEVRGLKPDLVLSSLTVPGHEKVVAELESTGLEILVCDPISLDDIYADIRRIARRLGVPERAEALVASMQAAMPVVQVEHARPKILVEWWPKPVIAPAKDSWVTDLIARAGGVNPWGAEALRSQPLTLERVQQAAPDIIVMSWCGVKVAKYRPELVRRRDGYADIPAVKNDRIFAISEEFLGRPGPRVVQGYRKLREAILAVSTGVPIGTHKT
ncbi:ABC transporter substrate-binding protein [Bradymonas sediminis]|uniref:ABC transporter substrate-binding protein n=1 Tax=Bradymonas sediminis TaxID=1548548 RepID=A0A2Z4FKJ7_9DELT|nr:cobalamin-binding protein [Bradymonas sediminis]AWV89228.1 ABC transporter substrate-binding protein [Bradymonas sediminis]TDP73395.1 iron complex transport system substrate-binding protein [Bradymonas sediminis]